MRLISYFVPSSVSADCGRLMKVHYLMSSVAHSFETGPLPELAPGEIFGLLLPELEDSKTIGATQVA